MKTFQEAISLLYSGDNPNAVAVCKENAERYLDIAQEAAENPKAHEMIRLLMEMRGLGRDCDCDRCKMDFGLMMSAFLNGVRVGMEMEKNV
jgi:hypothetical protein